MRLRIDRAVRLGSPCLQSNQLRAYSPALTAMTPAVASASPSGFTMKQLVFASVLSGVIVWGITGWLEGGSK